MTIGTEAVFWLVIFALVILANLVNEFWQYRKRKSIRSLYGMYKARTGKFRGDAWEVGDGRERTP